MNHPGCAWFWIGYIFSLSMLNDHLLEWSERSMNPTFETIEWLLSTCPRSRITRTCSNDEEEAITFKRIQYRTWKCFHCATELVVLGMRSRGGRSHIFRLRLLSRSKIYQSGSGSKKISNLRIRLLFQQSKFNNALEIICIKTTQTHAAVTKIKSYSGSGTVFFSDF